jgi:flavin-dependent dehydrogenase
MSLLVIGGGPAGAAAAITARMAGVDVTILDESRFPRFRPGETLHPGLEPLLASIHAESALLGGDYLRHSGTWVRWGARDEFVPFGADEAGSWRGFQAPRDDFDARLLAAARRAGAQVREGTAARSVLMAGGRVAGVETEDGPVHAAFTLDASGGKHWLARRLGISVSRRSPKLVARYGYVDAPLSRGELPRIRADAWGWTWMADLGHGRCLWTRVTEPERRSPKSWVPEEWQGLRTHASRGADVTWRMCSRTAGDGWFLCGDAAAVLDPSSSHGVLRAVMSGILAARFAVAVMAGAMRPGDAAGAYQQWMANWFYDDSVKMTEAYREAGLFGY